MAAYQQHQQMPSTPQSYMDIQGKFKTLQSTPLYCDRKFTVDLCRLIQRECHPWITNRRP